LPPKVDFAYFSFTEITDPREHASYNEWHLFDHVPENLALPGIVWGQRWVAAPDLQPAVGSDARLGAVHYVTAYLMREPADRTLGEFLGLGHRLRALGRFHAHRRALLGGPFRLVKTYATPRALVAADAVPYRPHRGVMVAVVDVDDARAGDEVARWTDDVLCPALVATPGVAGTCWFEAMPDAATTLATNPPRRTIHVAWLDGDPAEVSAAVRDTVAQIDEHDGAHLVFARVLRTVDPFGAFDWFDERAAP
jgi:hypothetical protein